MKGVSPKKRIYYPYCGYRVGFCLCKDGCKPPHGEYHACKYYRKRHPISKDKPRLIPRRCNGNYR